jgi:hypothetical protein
MPNCWFEKPLLLAVDTAAVSLAIHFHPLGFIYPIFPTHPEIVIVKGNANGFAHSFSDGSNELVVLKFAIQ